MNNYQYILFDWDGTLAKTLEIWLASLKIPLEKRGYQLSDKEIGANYEVLKKRMILAGEPEVEQIIAEAEEYSKNNTALVKLYPHVLETLVELKSLGITLGLVTTSLHAQIDSLLRKYSLEEVFDVVICGDDVAEQKPSAEPINKAIAILYAQPGQVLMVGDSEKDILSAKAAGVNSALFYPKAHRIYYNFEELLSFEPDFVIAETKQLIELVQA